jgi:putative DNA primase/helicase
VTASGDAPRRTVLDASQDAAHLLNAVDVERGLNDFGNALRLVYDELGPTGDARYVIGRGWFRRVGALYEPGDDWMKIRAARSVVKLFELVPHIRDEKYRSQVLAHANRSLRAERIRAALELAAAMDGIKIPASMCDASPFFAGCKNGILDLREGGFSSWWLKNQEKPFELDFITRKLGTEFDPAARCPQWETFLWEVFDGDEQMLAYIQRVGGYVLSGDTSEHVLFFCWGFGANGKSVLVGIFKALSGDYAATISTDTLMARHHGEPTNDLARLPGRRLVTAAEVEDGSRWAESLVKSVTGGDPIAARFLYREFFEFIPAFKLLVTGNHRPIVRGMDDGIWRRIHLIPFRRSFPPAQRDRLLGQKLLRELPGILNWALEGFRMWRELGLAPPAAVLAATAEYRSAQDRVGEFIDDKCELGPDFSVQASKLYRAYHVWAEARGEQPLAMSRFAMRLGERGFEKFKSNVLFYKGLRLLDSPEPAVSQ